MKIQFATVLIACLFVLTPVFGQSPKPGSVAAKQLVIEKELGRKGPWGEPGAPKKSKPVNISVNCNLAVGPNTTISGAIAHLDPLGAWVLSVSGACKENVVIQSFENISISAQPGASITDPSGGNLDVIDVFDTHEFSLQGFTINGGASGVNCADFSLCRFSGNTIQTAAGPGVAIRRSRASFQGDVIQNNGGRGLNILSGSTGVLVGVTIQNNAAAGVAAFFGSSLIAQNLVSQNNGGAGGVRISDHSTMRLIDSTLTANLGAGASVDSSSEAEFEDSATFNLISGNGGSGVTLGDLSFANFQGADQITGNNLGNPGGVDVYCGRQFSATRGALSNTGGGTTNCTEP
jgi:hypothetical protein